MRNTYYVRRSVDARSTHDINKLILRMSTPDKTKALHNAADSAIVNPGYYYYVYRDTTQIAKFYVEEEN